MDPLRLLTRSIKGRPKTPTSNQATPSAGPAANPQLFHQENSATRKRKRGSDGLTKRSNAATVSLDFFGGSSVRHDENDASGEGGRDDGNLEVKADIEQRQPDGLVKQEEMMSDEAVRELLAQHKVKVTVLNQPSQEDAAVKSKKSSKKKARRDVSSTTKSRTRLYPTPVTHFTHLRSKYRLSPTLAQNIENQGYSATTEVQLAALPLMLASPPSLTSPDAFASSAGTLPTHDPFSIDLLAVAPTGSGKTLAFMIPVIQALLRDRHQKKQTEQPESSNHRSRAIVLAPTKELASQIVNEARKLAMNTGVTVTNIRKGMRLNPTEGDSQVSLVKADVLVSTPLALLNALGGQSPDVYSLPDVRYLVLDEADVLLDPLFREQTLALWNSLVDPALRVSFWSATMGSNIEELAKATMETRASSLANISSSVVDAPLVRLVVGLKDSAVPNIHHQLIYAATEQGKLMALRQLLHPAPMRGDDQPVLRAPFIVFTQTIERAVALHSELQFDIPPEAGGISRISVLHSDLSETARDHVMTRFRKGEVWILITTDLLSRGVDFRGVNGVVNYDVPGSAAAYVHRVGRTGRAGREGGVALTYYTDDDVASIKTVANLIAASQKLRGSGATAQDVQQWLLDALPTPSKRDKQLLKKRGVESRRSAVGKDAKTGASKTRISTKSGYLRKLENNKRGAIAAARHAQEDASDAGSDKSFGGFDD